MDTMSVNVASVRSTTSVARARERARDFLEGLAPPTVAAEDADTVVLVVSELVTNAVRHAGGACTLGLTARPDSIEVAVDDPSRREDGDYPSRSVAPPIAGMGRP